MPPVKALNFFYFSLFTGGLAMAGDLPSSFGDLLIEDFEGADYGKWVVTGTAFGGGPAHGAQPNQMPVEGFQGRGLVNSYLDGDASTGTLTSPPFKIERSRIQFLIGGGLDAAKTCMHLVVDGKEVRTATGPNDRPGGSERLDWQGWDVTELAGRIAVIRIVDASTGPWGHINVDQIIQTDRALPVTLTNASREIPIERRYLNLPVKQGAPKRRVSLSLNGTKVREFEIELAD